ncbi:hypothetical protein KJ780_01455 [Candidatus Micrarchaeota archaeon]|nr:hypothetical protein [Candidatus Micrarchaeota archaeon]
MNRIQKKALPKPDEKPFQRGLPKIGPDEILLPVRYLKEGRIVEEPIAVPKALITAITDPGETGRRPLQIAEEVSAFYKKKLTPDLDSVVLDGLGNVPAAAVSALVRKSLDVHVVLASLDSQTRQGLFLDHPEVDKTMRKVAALMTGSEEVQIIPEEEMFIWVERTEVVNTPKIGFKTTRLECDKGSHKEVRNVDIPDGVTVEEAVRIREQRIASRPSVALALDECFTTISSLRGNPLSGLERNAVVSAINTTYIRDPENRIPIVPE